MLSNVNDDSDDDHTKMLIDTDLPPKSWLIVALFHVMQTSGMSGCHGMHSPWDGSCCHWTRCRKRRPNRRTRDGLWSPRSQRRRWDGRRRPGSALPQHSENLSRVGAVVAGMVRSVPAAVEQRDGGWIRPVQIVRSIASPRLGRAAVRGGESGE